MRQPGRGGRCARDLWVPGPEVRNCIPVSSHSCWTSRNMQSPGLGQGRPAACRGIRLPRARDPPLLEFNDGAAGCRGADAATYFLQTRVAPRSGFVLAGRACNRLMGACTCRVDP